MRVFWDSVFRALGAFGLRAFGDSGFRVWGLGWFRTPKSLNSAARKPI